MIYIEKMEIKKGILIVTFIEGIHSCLSKEQVAELIECKEDLNKLKDILTANCIKEVE